MDRPRRRTALLIAATAVVGFAGAGPAAPPPLRAMRWLAPGADAARILTHRRKECLGPARDADGAYRIEIGRAAFRDPLILGGQAARAGIACETCHQSGRANPDFDFPGVSGAPGTADVTASLFSAHRGDDVLDPRPIPDLAGDKAHLKIDQDPRSRTLERFIHGLITQEFDGPEPPPAVLDGLAAYVRALSPSVCPARQVEPLTLGLAIVDSRRAALAAQAALERNDSSTALVMIEAARVQLGAIAERFGVPEFAQVIAGVQGADRDLAAIQATIRAHRGGARRGVATWLAHTNEWVVPLRRGENGSYYSPARLAAAS